MKHAQGIQDVVRQQAQKFGVRVYRLANAGNHLHMIILPNSRSGFNSFVRSLCGIIARMVLGAERGSAKNVQFWDQRPFTRILEWGREHQGVVRYLVQNSLEALGFIEYTPRKSKLKNPPRSASS